MSLVVLLLGSALALSTAASTAFARDAPSVAPPAPLGSTDVPYPPGGQGDAVVVLELVVERDGTVSDATVLEGDAPFADQAQRGVLGWRFSPAHRGDVPVRVKIRARVAFHHAETATAPATGTTSAVATRSSAAATVAPAPDETPEEVTVRGSRREIGETTLSSEDIRELPGAFGDPFRAVEALPGVTPVVSGFPYFYVRGVPPNDNGYFVDGVRVPLLFHVGIGAGVIHPGLVDRIEFYPGAAPASYGGFAGGIIAGRTREPSATFHGEANLRLIDSGALVEAPFDGGRGSALVAARYGYPGPILGAITSTVTLDYWDYQARGTWRVAPRDTASVFAFGSHDYLGTKESGRGGGPDRDVEQLASDFHRIDLRYDHRFDHGRLRAATTLGLDSEGGAVGGADAAPATIRDRSIGVRMELEHDLGTSVLLRTGADAHVDEYGFTQRPPVVGEEEIPSGANPPPTNVTASAYADIVWHLSRRVELVPGARAGVFASWRPPAQSGASVRTIVPAIDPRLSARVTVADGVAWLSTLGLAHQYPALRVGPVPALVVTVPGFPYGSGKLQTAAQASQGVELALPADLSMTVTGFFSAWSGLTDLTANCIQLMPPVEPAQNGMPTPQPFVCPDGPPAHGVGYGVELLVRRPLAKRLNGLLSYTLSRATREAHFVTPSGGVATATVASDFDRTHVLQAALGYDLGRRWTAGARFVFYTGAPYSELSGNIPVPPYNSHRAPPFYRVDVRLEKRWPLGKDGSIAFVVEGQNVTLSREVSSLGLDCQGNMTPAGGTTQCTHGKIGPITLPSIGVEAFF